MPLPPRQALPTPIWRAPIIAKYNPSSGKLPYDATERPRSLEEGLNYFLKGFPPDIVFLLSIVWMMKRDPKMLERLLMKYLDTEQHIMVGLAQAGAGNIVSAYSGNFLVALMLEQNYMIRQRGADDLIASLNALTAGVELGNIFAGFAVPATLVFAGSGGTFPAGTAEVLGALRGAAKAEKEKKAAKPKAAKPITNVPLSKVP